MSFTIQAPHPALEVGSVLPNPQFSDSEALADEVEVKRAMNGKIRTYVKTKGGRKVLIWDFRLARPKMLELFELFKVHFASRFLIQDHNGRFWLGHFTNNPFEFSSLRAAGPAFGGVRGETYTVRFEFEGVEL